MKFKKIMSVLLSFIMVAAVFAGLGPIEVEALNRPNPDYTGVIYHNDSGQLVQNKFVKDAGNVTGLVWGYGGTSDVTVDIAATTGEIRDARHTNGSGDTWYYILINRQFKTFDRIVVCYYISPELTVCNDIHFLATDYPNAVSGKSWNAFGTGHTYTSSEATAYQARYVSITKAQLQKKGLYDSEDDYLTHFRMPVVNNTAKGFGIYFIYLFKENGGIVGTTTNTVSNLGLGTNCTVNLTDSAVYGHTIAWKNNGILRVEATDFNINDNKKSDPYVIIKMPDGGINKSLLSGITIQYNMQTGNDLSDINDIYFLTNTSPNNGYSRTSGFYKVGNGNMTKASGFHDLNISMSEINGSVLKEIRIPLARVAETEKCYLDIGAIILRPSSYDDINSTYNNNTAYIHYNVTDTIGDDIGGAYYESHTASGSFVAGNGFADSGNTYMTDFGYQLDNSRIIWKVSGISNDILESDPELVDGWTAYRSNAGQSTVGDRAFYGAAAVHNFTYEQYYSGRYYNFRFNVNEDVLRADYGEIPYGKYRITLWGRFTDGTSTVEKRILTKDDGGHTIETGYYFGKDVTSASAQVKVPVYVHNADDTVSRYDGYVEEVNSYTSFGPASDAYSHIVDGNGGVSSTSFGDDNAWISISIPNVFSGAANNLYYLSIKYRGYGQPVNNIVYFKTDGHSYYSYEDSDDRGFHWYLDDFSCTCDENWHLYRQWIGFRATNGQHITGIRIPTSNNLKPFDIECIEFSSAQCWSAYTYIDEILKSDGSSYGWSASPANGKSLNDSSCDVALGDMTQYFKNTFGVAGWAAIDGDDVTIEKFGYMTADGTVTLLENAKMDDVSSDMETIAGGFGVTYTGGNIKRFHVTGIPVEGKGCKDSVVYIVAKLTTGQIVTVSQVNYYMGQSYIDEVKISSSNPSYAINGITDSPVNVVKGEDLILRGWMQTPTERITQFGYAIDGGNASSTYSTDFCDDDRDFELALAYVKGAKAYYITIPSAAFTNLSTNTEHTLNVWAKTADNDTIESLISVNFNVLDFKISRVGAVILSGYNISFRVKADNTLFTSGTFDDPHVTFDGDTEVRSYVSGDMLAFESPGIMPFDMAKDVSIILSADRNGTSATVNDSTRSYSVKEYGEDLLKDYSGNTKLEKLVVNMLNYGAATQTYKYGTGEGSSPLANAGISSYQNDTYVPDDFDFGDESFNKQTLTNNLVDPAKVVWRTGGLILDDQVQLRFLFEIKDENINIDDIKVEFSYDGELKETVNTTAEFKPYNDSTTLYYCYLKMPANKMRTQISAVVKDRSDDTPYSETLTYSVATYAYKIHAKTGYDKIETLLQAMLKFGDAAEAFES